MRHETDVTRAREIRPGVAAIIQDGDGRILLQQRSDNGLWGLPGGSVEIGESVRDAIVREVRGESGLTVEVIRLVGIYSDPQLRSSGILMATSSTTSALSLPAGSWEGRFRPATRRWP